MTRASAAFLVATVFLLGFAVHAAVVSAKTKPGTALEASMGEIQWGWSPKQVYQHLKKGIEASYQEPISKTTDAIEEDRLRHKMTEESRQIRDSYFEFDGTPSAYDSGYLKGEFTQNNGESLLRVRTENTQDFFFFIHDRLWKRYRAFDASVFEGATFDEFGDALQKRYGKAKKRQGTLSSGSEPTQWYEWRQPRILAKAIDNTEFYGFYCLVLEDPKTVARLDELRKHKPATTDSQRTVVDLVGEENGGDRNADIADRISGKVRRHEKPPVDEGQGN